MSLSSPLVRTVLHAGVFALAVAGMTVTSLMPAHAQKGKPQPTNPPASVVFADDAGHGISSDATASSGPRPYVDAQEGVEATVFTNSGDLVLNLGSTRRINVSLGIPMQLNSDDPQEGAPTGSLVSAGTFYVGGIGFVPVGETWALGARLGGFTSLPNHPLLFNQLTRVGTLINGTPVCVTRVSLGQWNIATPVNGICVQPLSPGQPVPGDVAGMWSETTVRGKIKQTFVARYRLPFSASVTCLRDCPTQ